MNFGSDPSWKVNPHGALVVYSNQVSREYWKFKGDIYDIVYVVDRA